MESRTASPGVFVWARIWSRSGKFSWFPDGKSHKCANRTAVHTTVRSSLDFADKSLSFHEFISKLHLSRIKFSGNQSKSVKVHRNRIKNIGYDGFRKTVSKDWKNRISVMSQQSRQRFNRRECVRAWRSRVGPSPDRTSETTWIWSGTRGSRMLTCSDTARFPSCFDLGDVPTKSPTVQPTRMCQSMEIKGGPVPGPYQRNDMELVWDARESDAHLRRYREPFVLLL